MKKSFWLLGLLSLSLLTACGSGSGTDVGSGSTVSGGSAATAVTQGQAVDPYIQGAVFEEIGPTGTVLQARSSTSDAQGVFTFNQALTVGSTIQMLSSSNAQELTVSFKGELKRAVQAGDTGTLVVSPLTTLLADGTPANTILSLLESAGIQGLTVADLTRDPMQGLSTSATTVPDQGLALLQANMAANALMNAVGSGDLSSPQNQAIFKNLASGLNTALSSATFSQITGQLSNLVDPSAPPTLGDMIQTVLTLQQQMAAEVHNAITNGTVPDTSSIVTNVMATAATTFQGVYQQRTNPGSTSPDGATLYGTYCASCHGVLASSAKAGATASQIQTGINTISQMSSLASTLSSADIQAIASALATTTSPSTGTGSSTGTTPDGATLYGTYCASCHGALASSAKAGATASQIQTGINTISQMSALASTLSSADIQAIASALATTTGSGTGSSSSGSTTDCTSCHGMPPDGTTAPNIAGAHAIHTSLPNVGSNCNVCHNNSTPDNGTLEVNILSTYTAETGGTAGLDPDGSATCVNVSCHGGQTTPDWNTGTLDVNTQCTSCHNYGTSQYNSYNSGQHATHVQEVGLSCTTCHDTTKLAVNHFTHLDTSTMEGPASGTLKTSTGWDAATSTCSNSCHGTHNWFGGN